MEHIPNQDETRALCELAQIGDRAGVELATTTVTRSRRRQLEREVRTGHEAEAALVTGHRRLIHYLCSTLIKRIGVTDVPYDDLYQEACIGFLQAARAYDPVKGSLSNYATWRIRDQMQTFLRGNHGLSGKTAGTLLVTLRRYIPLLEEKLGRYPTAIEITELYNETTLTRYQAIAASKPANQGFSPTQMREAGLKQMKRRGVWLTEERVEALLRRQQSQISLDAPVRHDDGNDDREPAYLAGSTDVAEQATTAVDTERLRERVIAAVAAIGANDPDGVLVQVITLRFGLDGGEERSIQAIADELDMSTNKVRATVGVALESLRGVLTGTEAT